MTIFATISSDPLPTAQWSCGPGYARRAMSSCCVCAWPAHRRAVMSTSTSRLTGIRRAGWES